MLQNINGVPVDILDPDGPRIRTEQDAVDTIVSELAADWTVVPISRLDPDFFTLSTRVAGGIVQKFVNYHRGLAIIGDVSPHVTASEPFAAFVRECNRGRHTLFVSDVDDLAAHLTRLAGRPTYTGFGSRHAPE
ncbi:uncharacterized protein DUF4180 [Actinocrispum wychmicini]|uniref:Uncharacterized protein DUF4180 n=1 Tax=Actinocrispum wychmicini TaxID=1213861 RepID=A0A4R2J375_9PSEU|nr:uncharacterized protein DUF4180 [Actinocrispum wychmicini]